MKLCMIGTGYVGLVSGTCFADLGNKVYCVDKDKTKIKKLNSGKATIYEPGLDEILKKNYSANRLIFTSNISLAVKNSDIIFIFYQKILFITQVSWKLTLSKKPLCSE